MRTAIETRLSQGGMTLWQIMGVLTLVGFFALLAVKMGPAYSDNRVAAQNLQSLQEAYANADVQELTDSQIRGKLGSNFQVNMVPTYIEEAVQIERNGKEVKVSINYEVKEPLFANVAVLMTFENEVILGQ